MAVLLLLNTEMLFNLRVTHSGYSTVSTPLHREAERTVVDSSSEVNTKVVVVLLHTRSSTSNTAA